MKNSAFTLWSGPPSREAMELFPNEITYALPADCEITDGQSLTAAYRAFPVPVYDDGYGKVRVLRDSMGISGIVRAQGWYEAWETCEDEFFPEAGETVEELRAEYNHTQESVKIVRDAITGLERPVESADYSDNGRLPEGMFVGWKTVETPADDGEDVWTENELFQEAYGFRPNGPNVQDVHGHGIYQKDLNGESLDTLTPELRERLGIILYVQNQL